MPIEAPASTDQEAQGVLLDLAAALHRVGTTAPRLESTVEAIAQGFGVEVAVFSTPTALFMAVGPLGAQTVSLLREKPAVAHLERLVELHRLCARIVDEGLDPAAARSGLRGILAHGSPPPAPWLVPFVQAGSSASAAVFAAGGWPEVLTAGAIGALLGLWDRRVRSRPAEARLFVVLAAVAASAVAALVSRFVHPLAVPEVVLSGLIVLLPGLSITIALRELATQHLASGTARLGGALTELALLGFGCACGLWLGGGAGELKILQPVPDWVFGCALLLAPITFAVLFRARRRDWPGIVVTGVVAVLVARLGSSWLDPEPGAVLASLAVGVCANLYGRLRRVPSTVLQLPGLILLVPGSVGFRSVWALLEHEVQVGVDAAFEMVKLAVALVCGLLLANLMVPPARLDEHSD